MLLLPIYLEVPPFILRLVFLFLRQKDLFLPLEYLQPEVLRQVARPLPRQGDFLKRRTYECLLERLLLRIDLVLTIIK